MQTDGKIGMSTSTYMYIFTCICTCGCTSAYVSNTKNELSVPARIIAHTHTHQDACMHAQIPRYHDA